MKKVIIIGATSMLGVAFVHSCIQQNIECLCLVRNNSTKINRLPKSHLVEIQFCNLEDLELFQNIESSRGYDTFFHLGWEGTSKEKRLEPLIQSKNIQYTLNAVNLAKRFGCKRFVGIGSQAEYGRVKGPINSSTFCNPDIAYGVVKYSAGKLSALLCEQLNIEHVWGRVFSLYGPWENEGTLIHTLLNNYLTSKDINLTKAEQLWDYLYVYDGAKAVRLLGEYGKNMKTYNIGSGRSLPLRKYIEIFHAIAKTESKLIFGANEYTENQVMNLSVDIKELISDTGFIPQTSFDEGIKRTIHWWKEQSK